jgi:hypothetical protein
MIAAQNSTRTAPTQRGKPWQKGQSGNPGGRPKVAADLKEAARRHTQEALNRLVFWMRSDDPQASIRASTAILDRGCGKPAQEVTQKVDLKPEEIVVRWMTREEAVKQNLDPSSIGAINHLSDPLGQG